MKIAIFYESRTGNTETIARAIKEQLGDAVVYYGAPALGVDADLYVIGSWTDKGQCVSPISDILMALRDTRVAYFCTAGFATEEYSARLIERAESMLDPSVDILGAFASQGKMPSAVRDRYVAMIHANPDDEHLKVAIENFDKASTHPDATDIANAKAWIQGIVDKME